MLHPGAGRQQPRLWPRHHRQRGRAPEGAASAAEQPLGQGAHFHPGKGITRGFLARWSCPCGHRHRRLTSSRLLCVMGLSLPLMSLQHALACLCALLAPRLCAPRAPASAPPTRSHLQWRAFRAPHRMPTCSHWARARWAAATTRVSARAVLNYTEPDWMCKCDRTACKQRPWKPSNNHSHTTSTACCHPLCVPLLCSVTHAPASAHRPRSPAPLCDAVWQHVPLPRGA